MKRDIFERLAEYLRKQVSGFGELREASKFSGGQSNPTYLLETDTDRYVLRRKPSGPILPSAHAIDREYRLLLALAVTNVPVAPALHYCSDTRIIGSEFYLMEFVDGVVHWDPALPSLDPGIRRPMTFAMVDTLAALHSVDLVAVGLTDFGKSNDYAARQIARWKRQYRATQVEDDKDIEALIAWLEQSVPDEDGAAALVHGDFRIDNLMYRAGGPEVVAVLDWELATVGHPLADLAYMLMHHRLANDGVFKGLGGISRAALKLPTETEIIARYCNAVGRSEVPDLGFWISLSAFSSPQFLKASAPVSRTATRRIRNAAASWSEQYPTL